MDFLIAKKYFFQHVVKSNLTGEQLRGGTEIEAA